MTTLVGLFFSVISVFGFFKGSSKRAARRFALIFFSLLLILGQFLFLKNAVHLDSHQFVGFSGLLSGVILILAFQKEEAL
jgi:hypothetical protein